MACHQAIGRSRGGRTTKIYALCDEQGRLPRLRHHLLGMIESRLLAFVRTFQRDDVRVSEGPDAQTRPPLTARLLHPRQPGPPSSRPGTQVPEAVHPCHPQNLTCPIFRGQPHALRRDRWSTARAWTSDGIPAPFWPKRASSWNRSVGRLSRSEQTAPQQNTSQAATALVGTRLGAAPHDPPWAERLPDTHRSMHNRFDNALSSQAHFRFATAAARRPRAS